MGDFLGSYFLETDEEQVGRDIRLQEDAAPVPVVSIGDIQKKPEADQEVDDEDDFALDADEDFAPVAVATMSQMEPGSLMAIHLTRKGAAAFKMPADFKPPTSMPQKGPPASPLTPTPAKGKAENPSPNSSGGLVKNVIGRFRRPVAFKDELTDEDTLEK